MDLANIENDAARVTVTSGRLTAIVDYHPLRVSAALQTGLVEMNTSGDPRPFLAEMARVIRGWDLTRGGEPIPTTVAGLETVGLALVIAAFRAIMEDFHDPKLSTPSSDGSSGGGASAATAPTTPPSSGTPAGPASPPGPSPDSTTPPAATPGASG